MRVFNQIKLFKIAPLFIFLAFHFNVESFAQNFKEHSIGIFLEKPLEKLLEISENDAGFSSLGLGEDIKKVTIYEYKDISNFGGMDENSQAIGSVNIYRLMINEHSYKSLDFNTYLNGLKSEYAKVGVVKEILLSNKKAIYCKQIVEVEGVAIHQIYIATYHKDKGIILTYNTNVFDQKKLNEFIEATKLY